MEKFTGSRDPITITTLVKFSNQASTWFRFTEVDQTTPTQFHLAWDTVNGLIEHDFNFGYYHGYVTLPKLAVDTPLWQFNVKNVALNLDANTVDGQYNSSNTLTTESLTIIKNKKI